MSAAAERDPADLLAGWDFALGRAKAGAILPRLSFFACLAVLAVIGLFDMAMTSEGLLLTRLVIDHAYGLDREMLARVFAGVIFAVVFLAGAIWATMPWRHTPLALKAAMLVVALGWLAGEATDGFFHAVLLTNQARGAGLEQALLADAISIENRITDADRQIARAYDAQVSDYVRLSDDAAQGRDETRAATCGPICRDAMRNARALRAVFSDLAVPIETADDGNAATNLPPAARAWFAAQRRFALLRPKAARYLTFCAREQRKCDDPATAIERDPAYLRLQHAFAGDAVMDRPALVIDEVYAAMKSIIAGTGSIDVTIIFWLAVLLLPALKITGVCAARCFLWQAREGHIASLAEQVQDGDRIIGLGAELRAQRAFMSTI